MIRRLRVEDAAREELRAAVAWYEERRPGLGEEFLAEVHGTLELIRDHPDLGGTVPQVPSRLQARRLPVRRFPYSVIYRRRGTMIEVLAVAHHRREPGYWRSR